MNIPSVSRRIQLALLVLALVAVSVVSLPQNELGAATSCTARAQGSTFVLAWSNDGSTYNVRRDGDWIARAADGVSSFIDHSPTADPTYQLVVRNGDTTSRITCQNETSAPVAGCTLATQGNGSVLLTWEDDGGTHIVRRNGDWLATPGAGVSRFVDTDPVAGATYLIRTRAGTSFSDRSCAAGTPTTPEPPAPTRRFVIHVSIDGLRADAINFTRTPTLNRMLNQGASTRNARTDPSITRTLPNHLSQFTGRYLWGTSGHRVSFNEDNGRTVHLQAGSYVPSVYDVVSDRGGRTVMYHGKDKFNFVDRSYNATNGAPDTVGIDNGPDKIDVAVKENPVVAPAPFVSDLTFGSASRVFGFFHIRTPDEYGHAHGWDTAGYREGLEITDAIVADLINEIDAAGILDQTTFIVTADHGGPTGETSHGASANPQNYTVPFIVWGRDAGSGVDLYDLNPQRTDPGTGIAYLQGPQPIRGHDAANLALDLLNLPAISGSSVNADQDLRIR